MNRIFNRVILITLMALSMHPIEEEKTIYTVLAAIIYTGMGYFLEGNRIIDVLPEIFLGIMLVLGEIFIPVIILVFYGYFYLVIKLDKKAIMKLSALSVLIGIRWLLISQSDYLLFKNEWFAISLISLIIFACYLSVLTYDYEKMKSDTLKMMDDTEELKLLMAQKNALHRERQDNEIYTATLKERNRIAREIHDNVGHLLTRSILQMGALKAIYKEEPLKSSLEQVSETLNESMLNIRQSVHDLHNEALDLKANIENLIVKSDSLTVDFDYDIDENVKREIKYALISIVTECFENVRKHSDATRVELAMREHPAFYQLIFIDNGTNARIKEGGIGLHNMESRVNELGGNIRFGVKNGFRIFIIIPKE